MNDLQPRRAPGRAPAQCPAPRLQEKRKRDLGMQGGGRNYIEEEKRVARNFGFYSGFDT